MAGLKRRGFVAAAAGLGLAPALARGQAYPNKQVRVVVPYPAGGGTDLVARLIMPRLAERWKQSVIIDNKGGASGILGSDIVAKAAPDGYTLLVMTSAHTINPYTTKPVQGPSGSGSNYALGASFGRPRSPLDYQTPRTFRFSVGIRF